MKSVTITVAKIFLTLCAIWMGINLICPSVASAGPARQNPINEDGSLRVELTQNFLRNAEPDEQDIWFSKYNINSELYLEVDKNGLLTIVNQQNRFTYGNIHLPESKKDTACVVKQDGSWIVEGNNANKYYYGKIIDSIELSLEVGTSKKLVPFDKYNIILALTDEGNVYSIDLSDGQVYTMREYNDVQDIVLSNFLGAPDLQISILTFKNEWLYTMEPRVGEWCHVRDDVLKFKCDKVVTK